MIFGLWFLFVDLFYIYILCFVEFQLHLNFILEITRNNFTRLNKITRRDQIELNDKSEPVVLLQRRQKSIDTLSQ